MEIILLFTAAIQHLIMLKGYHMNIDSKSDRSGKAKLSAQDGSENASRRNGNIRGIILSKKEVNLDQVFGLTQAVMAARF